MSVVSITPVLVIPTQYGDAVRFMEDVESANEEYAVLKPSAALSFIGPAIPSRILVAKSFSLSDLPDLSKTETEISNVCGFVAGVCQTSAVPFAFPVITKCRLFDLV